MQQVLATKWRPRQFDQVIGQAPIVQALSNALANQHLHHAYLFTGTRGVGKTTIARIIAKCLNCETGVTATPCETCSACQEITAGHFPDLFEIDAASRTKVEDTREILDNVQYSPTRGRYKIYLIDEIHMLSGHSFNALLKTLEEPPSHVKFLLATTDPQKLPATVLSRCLQFHLRPMPSAQIASHLQHILTKEDVPFEKDALTLVSKAANGSMRDALSLLDQGIAFGNRSIKTNDIKTMLGTVDSELLLQILEALQQHDADAIIKASETLATNGADFSNALAALLEQLHHIAILQFTSTSESANQQSALKPFAQALSAEQVQLYYQIVLLGQKDLALAPNPRVGFEMTLLRMLAFTPDLTTNSMATSKPSARTATAPKTTPQATQATQTTTTTAAQTANQWLDILNQITLPGATNALAQACSLESISDGTLNLTLEPNHQALLNDRHIDRINQAVSTLLNKPMRAKITLGTSGTDSAATIKQSRQQQRHQQAENQILQDENVQQIIKTFDATVLKDSITIENDN